MKTIRCAAAISLLGIVPAILLVAAPPASASPTAVTVSDQSAIEQYYQSKEAIGRGVSPAALHTSSVAAAASVGSAYIQDFYASYADDPDLTIGGVDITPKILSKVVTGSSTQFRVSVRVSFKLHDKSDGTDFTGGETLDHLVQTSTGTTGPTTAATVAKPYTVSKDTTLDVSTAPVNLVVGDAEDTQLSKAPSKALPAWQVQLKQQHNDGAGKGASAAKAEGETGGTAASENAAERADAASSKDTAASADNEMSASSDINYFPQLAWQKAADYAALWTDDDHADKLNSKYGDAGDNCTNFASQALYVGGWKTHNTTALGKKWKSRWHWNYHGPGHFTYTWSRAHYNYRRMVAVANRPTFSSLDDAALADLVYFDWDVGGATYGDGQMDHVMFVTKRTKKHPYFSQKSGNRHNVSPKTVRKNIGDAHYTVYGIRT